MLDNVGTSTQYTALFNTIGDWEDFPPSTILAIVLSWDWRTIWMTLMGQPNFDTILHRPCWLMVSKAFLRSTKVVQRSQLYSWHLSRSWYSAKMFTCMEANMTGAARLAPDDLELLQELFFPAIESKHICWWLSHTFWLLFLFLRCTMDPSVSSWRMDPCF